MDAAKAAPVTGPSKARWLPSGRVMATMIGPVSEENQSIQGGGRWGRLPALSRNAWAAAAGHVAALTDGIDRRRIA